LLGDNRRLTEQAKKIRVALLYGGRSGEHEVSLRSAESVRAALDDGKYEVIPYLIAKDGKWSPHALSPEPGGNAGIDVVFPVLHGTFGEDGTIQGLLELADLPYVGAGVLASAVSMDKSITKKLCAQANLPVVEHVILHRGDFYPATLQLPFPYPAFVKPANLGSSVGITKVKDDPGFHEALAIAMRYDEKVIVERGVTGREFECAVLGGRPPKASVPCEIIPSQEFYTYEDKYLLDQARIELPPKLTADQIAELQCLAVTSFDTVGCEGMARVDFLMSGETGKFYVNEINTIPGFTSISMYPKMLEYSGIPYPVLLDRLIELALLRFETKKQTQYSR
jgi:D-alanine-D-alanine ligase